MNFHETFLNLFNVVSSVGQVLLRPPVRDLRRGAGGGRQAGYGNWEVGNKLNINFGQKHKNTFGQKLIIRNILHRNDEGSIELPEGLPPLPSEEEGDDRWGAKIDSDDLMLDTWFYNINCIRSAGGSTELPGGLPPIPSEEERWKIHLMLLNKPGKSV